MRVEPHMHELSRRESMTLLGTARLARVAVSVDALPVVLPVFFTMVDDQIVFRAVPGTKLAAAVDGTIVAVEADGLDERTGDGWSVLVRGHARAVTDGCTAERARERLGSTWLNGSGEHLIEVTTDLVTGRRLG
jgi:nitroimidazol reductase NimA-like FMN-containing flavoprotein (pyridoxamine 5'-phosphate oxidase superfamily)